MKKAMNKATNGQKKIYFYTIFLRALSKVHITIISRIKVKLMIKIENLTKRYSDKTAVDRLNITLKPGVVTGFLGPNGSGKSTTMKMIISLVHPTHGQATV